MSENCVENAQQVTPDRLMQLAWGFAPPLLIEAAVRVDLFSALVDGPRSANELAAAIGCSRRGTRVLADALVGLGLLEHRGDGFALTPESCAFLVPGKPTYQGGFFKRLTGHMVPKWLRLAEAVRTGAPVSAVNQEEVGAEFFAEFVEDLIPLSWPAAHALARHLGVPDAEGPVSVLDLACGSAVWSIAIARQCPRVRVTAVDWPAVIPTTRRVTERFGVAGQYSYVEGDLLEADFGSGHIAAVLGHILHSEGEARSRALLRKVHEALAPGGTIAIAEFLVNEERTGPLNGLIFAANMLVNTDCGDAYSAAEIGEWLEDAGFAQVRLLDAPGPSPLILATRPA